MQFSLFGDDQDSRGNEPINLALPEASVHYYPSWLAGSEASNFRHRLETELPWSQDTIKLFGKAVKIPRLQSWHGDPDCAYTYSGLTMTPNPWTPALSEIRQRCEATLSTPFNSVLANWYRHGQDSMSLHADDEPELGPTPTIASVTLGEARPFIFKHRETGKRYTHVLEHGSLLVMAGTTQSHYVHGIAKTQKPVDGRINLTFRFLYPR
ncbi:alpha-ketoglutarate-dependent dioxygenase AlkB family protein [Alteromonas antoniana]|uniref:alpha-ketoglutarate-dependent dioxygenase AlkB family protein n=1 Tax=Alteromonas antoniana TaxID=2803813 RepID=UPI001C482F51